MIDQGNDGIDLQPARWLQDKVAVITGAGSGIGKAASLLFAQHGAKVMLIDVNEARLLEVQAEITQTGSQVMVFETDITDPGRMEKAFDTAVSAWGKLDIVFANAGINGTIVPIEDMSLDDWNQTLSINLTGTFLTVKYAVPQMKHAGGSIIITSSINGTRIFNNVGFSAYGSAKAGQVTFMKMAALELARYNIRVNAICPGYVQTNLFENTWYTPEMEKVKWKVNVPKESKPLNYNFCQPAQVAELALFLASDMSSHITGTEVFIDGAASLV